MSILPETRRVCFALPLLLSLASFGCSPVGARTDAGVIEDAGDSHSAPRYDWRVEEVGPDDPSRNGGLGLAVGSDGELAVAYFVDLTSTQHCITNFDEKDVAESRLMLARGNLDGFTVSTVDTPRSADGVALAFDNTGQLNVAYVGGDNGGMVCAATDLMLATYSGTSPSSSTMAADSASGATCRLMQNVCNSGDVVGRFPSIAFDDDNTRLVSFQDVHFGIAVEGDLEGADLEVLVGGTRTTVDDSSGAGNHTRMIVADGRPAVAHVVIVDHQFESGHQSRGVWLAWLQADGTWQRNLIDATVPTNQLGAAWHATLGFAVAWQDPVEKDLMVATSSDGTTWEVEAVHVLGSVGSTPSVAFTGSRLLVAYGVCSGPQDTGSGCSVERDGVRLAFRDGNAWSFSTVYNSEEYLEGSDVRMALTSDGRPVIAFKSQGTRKVMVAMGTPR